MAINRFRTADQIVDTQRELREVIESWIECCRIAGIEVKPSFIGPTHIMIRGYTRATMIAQELGISQQAAGKTLKEMMLCGLVEQSHEDNDARARSSSLTALGTQAYYLLNKCLAENK